MNDFEEKTHNHYWTNKLYKKYGSIPWLSRTDQQPVTAKKTEP